MARGRGRIRTLSVRVTATTRDYTKKMKKVMNITSKVGSRMKNIGFSMARYITLPFAAAGAGLAKLAMDAIESENLFTVAMGKYADSTRKWSNKIGKALGLNSYMVRQNVATYQSMFTGWGIAEDKSAKLSTAITLLTYDIASLQNLSFDESMEKVQAGLAGLTQPLGRLGKSMHDATIRELALKKGLISEGEVLTQQQKVLLRYLTLLNNTKNEQGDLARTINDPANQLRVLTSGFKELGIKLGTPLLEPLGRVMTVLQQLSGALMGMSKGMIKALLGASAFVAILPVMIILVGSLIAVFSTAIGGAVGVATALGFIATAMVTAVGAFAYFIKGHNKVQEALENMYKGFKSFMNAVIKAWNTWGAEWTLKIVQYWLNKGLEITIGILNSIGEMFVITGQALNGDWGNAFKGIIKITDRWNTIMGSVILDGLIVLLRLFKKAGTSMAEFILTPLANMLQGARTTLKKLLDLLPEDQIIKHFNKLYNSLQTKKVTPESLVENLNLVTADPLIAVLNKLREINQEYGESKGYLLKESDKYELDPDKWKKLGSNLLKWIKDIPEKIKKIKFDKLKLNPEDFLKDYEEVEKLIEDMLKDLKGETEDTDVMEDLATNVKNRVKEIYDSIKSLTQEYTRFVGVFERASYDAAVSGDRWLNRLKGQVREITTYQKSIAILQEKVNKGIIPEEMLNEFKDLGISAAKQLNIVANLDDAKLKEAGFLYQTKMNIAHELAVEKVTKDEEQKYYEELLINQAVIKNGNFSAELLSDFKDLVTKATTEYEKATKIMTDVFKQQFKDVSLPGYENVNQVDLNLKPYQVDLSDQIMNIGNISKDIETGFNNVDLPMYDDIKVPEIMVKAEPEINIINEVDLKGLTTELKTGLNNIKIPEYNNIKVFEENPNEINLKEFPDMDKVMKETKDFYNSANIGRSEKTIIYNVDVHDNKIDEKMDIDNIGEQLIKYVRDKEGL